MAESYTNSKLFGLRELDEVLGSIPSNYVLVFKGSPGTGKTSFTIQTVYRNVVEQGSKVLYITTNEGSEKLRIIAKSIGCDFDKYKDRIKVLEFLTPGDEDIIDILTSKIVEGIEEGFDIIVIDSITPVLKVLGTYSRMRAWLHTVVYRIVSSAQNVLMILVADKLVEEDPIVSVLEYLADVVIEFYYDFKRMFPFSRYFRITKFRARHTPSFPIYFMITREGIIPINLVSEKLAENTRKKRKIIHMSEEPLKKLFGEELIPGTQIGVIIKQPATAPTILHNCLMLKLGIEALLNNINIGIICYGPKGCRVDYNVKLLSDLIRNKLTIIDADPTQLEETTYRVTKEWISKPENLDVLIVAGYEKIAEFYNIYEVNKLIALYSRVDKKLGITTFRIYWVSEAQHEIPSVIFTMSDIVLETTLDEKKGRINIKAVKAPHIRKPVIISDTELEHTIEALRRKVQAIIASREEAK